MLKNYHGPYTASVAKVLKASGKLFCQVDEAGSIYLCNGFLIFKMSVSDYTATAQKVLPCTPGPWSLDQDGLKPRSEDDYDLSKEFAREVAAVEDAADAAALQRTPMIFQQTDPHRKATMAAFYNASADFAAFFNSDFIAAVDDSCTFRTLSPISPAIVYSNNEPIAMILPVRPDPNNTRAVRAYFASSLDREELEKVRFALNAEKNETAKLQEIVDDLDDENRKLRRSVKDQVGIVRWLLDDGLSRFTDDQKQEFREYYGLETIIDETTGETVERWSPVF
jgi:hypothetical protein